MERIDFKNYPDESTPLSAENLNQLQTNIEEAIGNLITIENLDTQQGVIVLGDVRIEYGMLDNLTVPASGYESAKITFSKAFSTTPAVFLQEKGNYNIKADLSGNTTTEATVNVRSIDGYERTGRSIYWFAIGKN